MNVLFIVIDSLRYDSLWLSGRPSPRTPFLERFDKQCLSFRRAYASECWTLPTHMSLFTGLLPSQHGSHFQQMEYRGRHRTLAEAFAGCGYTTELLTRNSILDGTIPGVTRGFARNTQVLADIPRGMGPLMVLLAMAKPRVRRLIRKSGFFGMTQKVRSSFVLTLARMGIPADLQLLQLCLERLAAHKRHHRPSFMFLNLYDVHAPYSPSTSSPLRPLDSPGALLENLSLPWLLPKISNHGYLQRGFTLSRWGRRMLLERYHRAIELMDAKLRYFFTAADGAGILDDTLVVVTSDHGEAFGEHGLYLHDASVYDTHLHVPLWIRHPALDAATVHDVVSTRDLCGTVATASLQQRTTGGLLDRDFRMRNCVAYAEHFHYPHAPGVRPEYQHNLAAAVMGDSKLIRRGEHLEYYDLINDPGELSPERTALKHAEDIIARTRLSADSSHAVHAHLLAPSRHAA